MSVIINKTGFWGVKSEFIRQNYQHLGVNKTLLIKLKHGIVVQLYYRKNIEGFVYTTSLSRNYAEYALTDLFGVSNASKFLLFYTCHSIHPKITFDGRYLSANRVWVFQFPFLMITQPAKIDIRARGVHFIQEIWNGFIISDTIALNTVLPQTPKYSYLKADLMLCWVTMELYRQFQNLL